MGRILVFTGKGGVGKTSIAAAHALHSAKEGKRTLLVSTDMAHNLSDLFEQSLGREEKEVVKNLFALEIDPSYLLEHEFVHLKNSLFQMLHSSKTFNAKPDELFTFPGMDELLSLIVIMDRYKQGNYERIIVDCAPTGETLSLLKFPELLSWYMEKWFPVGKVAVRMLAPISKHFFKVVLPDRKAMTEIERIYIKLMELQELLKDPFITSIRLVANPEKMVVEETKRNYMYMNLFGFHVDGLYINRILPRELENPFL